MVCACFVRHCEPTSYQPESYGCLGDIYKGSLVEVLKLFLLLNRPTRQLILGRKESGRRPLDKLWMTGRDSEGLTQMRWLSAGKSFFR